MSTTLLNAIIGFSLLGIIGITAHDALLKKPTVTANVQNLKTTPPQKKLPKSVPTEHLVPCESDYFTFTQGTTWRYKMTSSLLTDWNQTASQSAKPKSITFINRILALENGRAIIETTYPDSDETSVTELLCKPDGIYGFPWPLIPLSVTSGITSSLPVNILGNLKSTNISFLPTNPDLSVGDSWNVKIPIKLNLGIPLGDFDFEINNTVLSTRSAQIAGHGSANTYAIAAKPSMSGLPIDISSFGNNLGKMQFDYTLANKVGLTQMLIKIPFENTKGIDIDLRLLNFREGNNSN